MRGRKLGCLSGVPEKEQTGLRGNMVSFVSMKGLRNSGVCRSQGGAWRTSTTKVEEGRQSSL